LVWHGRLCCIVALPKTVCHIWLKTEKAKTVEKTDLSFSSRFQIHRSQKNKKWLGQPSSELNVEMEIEHNEIYSNRFHL